MFQLASLTHPLADLGLAVDFDLEWVSKYNNLEKAAFWQEDCRHARHDIITQARNGGS